MATGAWWDQLDPHVQEWPPSEPRDVNRYRITLDQLEEGVHVPADQQVSSQPAERPPASTYEDEAQRQLRLAGGA